MRLDMTDMSLYGTCPETDIFVAVVCAYCSAVVKPQGLQKHIHIKHRHSQSRGYAHTSSAPGSNSKFIASFYASTTSGTSHTVTITNATSATATFNGSTIIAAADAITKVVAATTSSSSSSCCGSTQQMAPPVLVGSNTIGQSTKGKNRSQGISSSSSSSTVSSSSASTKLKSKSSGSVKSVSGGQPVVSLVLSRGGKTVPSPKNSESVQANTASPDSNSAEINATPATDELDTTPELSSELASVVVLLDPISEISSNDSKPLLKKRSRNSSLDQRAFLLKDREYDPNKHCGVMTTMMSGSSESQPRPCTRSLTCKTHALALRRHVQGRRCSFDQLLYDHRATKDSNNKTNPSITKVSAFLHDF